MKKILLSLLVALIAAGGWNYHRNANLAVKDETPRPFKSLSVEQLDALIAANQQERDRYARALESIETQGSPAESHASSDLAANLGGFERAQKHANRVDQVQAAMLDREVEISQLQRERGQRAGMPDTPLTLAWRRLITF